MKLNALLVKIFLVFISLDICSCHNAQKEKFVILTNPIYSETDTPRSSTNDLERNRTDYFLVKGSLRNKSAVISSIDSFANKVGKINSRYYDNYSMSFYHMTPEVNQEEIRKYKDQKYEMFELNQQDQIIAYTFYESKLIIRIINK